MKVIRIAAFCSLAFAALPGSVARGQVAPIPYWRSIGAFGLNAGTSSHSITQIGDDTSDPMSDDNERKGFSFRSFSTPVSAFGSGLAWRGALGFSSGLAAEGAQYGYSFKGIDNIPVTLFGGVDSLRSNPDVFTSLVTPGFSSGRTLATSVNAGVEFKPASNISLSFSAGVVQPGTTVEGDLRSRLLSEQPMFLGGRH